MSELERLKDQIRQGKVRPEKLSPEWAYQRAWNDALAWVEEQIRKIEKGEA